MKVLITGGAGFIGSNLANFLTLNNEKITIIDNLSTGNLNNVHNILPFYDYTIGDDKFNNLINDLIKESDVVFHLAATVGVKNVIENCSQTIHNNIKSTEIILEACKNYKKKLFVASTSEVYGKNLNTLNEYDDITLGSPYMNRWSYAASKLIDEFLTLDLAYKYRLPFTVLRFFNISGPGQVGRYGMVIPRFIDQALNNEDLTIFGDGQQTRCFTSIKDVVEILYDLMNYDDNFINGKIINIGNPSEVKIIDLANHIIKVTKSKSKIKLHSEDDVYGIDSGFEDMKRRFPDISLMKDLIGHSMFDDYMVIVDDILESRGFKLE